MAGIPSPLIDPLRAALNSQGFPGSAIDDSGNINPLALLGGVYSSMEIRTGITPPITVDLTTMGAPGTGAPPSMFAKFLQPTLILYGVQSAANPKGDRAVLAPYGEASSFQGTLVILGIVAAIFGAGYLAASSKR